jgi:hypothetical protein
LVCLGEAKDESGPAARELLLAKLSGANVVRKFNSIFLRKFESLYPEDLLSYRS